MIFPHYPIRFHLFSTSFFSPVPSLQIRFPLPFINSSVVLARSRNNPRLFLSTALNPCCSVKLEISPTNSLVVCSTSRGGTCPRSLRRLTRKDCTYRSTNHKVTQPRLRQYKRPAKNHPRAHSTTLYSPPAPMTFPPMTFCREISSSQRISFPSPAPFQF